MVDDKHCNACGGSLEPWLYMPIDAKKNEPTIHNKIFKCVNCALGVIHPLPKANDIQEFYELQSYYTHGESHITPRASNFFDRILTKLAWIADKSRPFQPEKIADLLPTGGRVCDMGCGHAKYLQQFRQLGFDVIGVDPDPEARACALEAGIRVEAGTGEDIPPTLPEASFDLVIMTHSLEHCRDPHKALQNAYRLTKPGGYCYIEVPNCAAEHFQMFTICSEMFDAPRHIYFFTPTNLSALMTRLGFSQVQMLYTGYVRDFSPSWRGWESKIAERVKINDPKLHPKFHNFTNSIFLLLRSFWQSAERKYDSFGLLMQRKLN